MIKRISIVLIALLIGIANSAFYQNTPAKSIERGKEIYITHCQNCHLADGKGTPDMFPPLAKADYLKKPGKQLIEIILKGQNGEITVNGKKYNAQMPAQEYLTDEEISDVLNYVRNSWGNKISGTITPAQVKALRNTN